MLFLNTSATGGDSSIFTEPVACVERLKGNRGGRTNQQEKGN